MTQQEQETLQELMEEMERRAERAEQGSTVDHLATGGLWALEMLQERLADES